MVEDSELDAGLLARELERSGFAPTWQRVENAADLKAALAGEPWDLVLSDYAMPGFTGLDALEIVRASGLDLPFILISGTIGEETAVTAMKAGAHDYLLKDQLTRLGSAVTRELRDAEERRGRRRAEAAARAAQAETLRLLNEAEQARIRLLSVVEDQKLTEARLRVRTTALEATANAIVITDRNGAIQWANPAWTALTGYTVSEVVGRNTRLLKSGVQDKHYYRDLWDTILAGQVWHGELVNRRKDGSHYDEEETITPVTDTEGRITHFIGIKQDITERKRAQQELEQSHERYRRAIIAANAVPYQKDYGTDTYVFMGEGIKDITGYAPHELRSPVWKQIVLETVLYGEAAQLPMAEASRRVVAGQLKEWRVDHRIRTRSGEERWISDSSISLYDATGKYTGSLGIIEDITERKQAETVREALLSLTTQLSEVQTPAEVARTIFTTADRLWKWDAGTLDAYAPEDDLLETVFCCDIVDGERREVPPAGTRGKPTPRVRRVMTHGPELILRAPHEPQAPDSVRFGDTARLSASIMCVPIRRQGQPVGVLSVQSYTPDAFTKDDLQTLQGLADHCCGALERLRAEMALRESENRFQQVTEHLGEWVWEVDANGLYTYTSPVVERTLGYHPDEIVGKRHFYDFFPEAERETLKRAVFERFHTQQPFTRFRNHCVHHDGRLVLLETSGTPLVDRAGRLLGYRGVAMDITQREQAEEQIRSQAQMLDLAQDAIAIRSLDGVVRYWNKGYERLTGWTVAEAVGQPVVQLLQLDPEHFKQATRTLMERGEWSGEGVIRSKDGRRLTLLSRWALVRDGQGRPKEVLTINTDITEQKKLEAQFLRAQRMESVGRLAGGIAHDLNNILAPILMATGLLREESPSAEARVMIDTLEGSAQRGAEVVKQLLTFARGTEGQKIPVPPGHLVREMSKIIRETFPRSITARTDLPKEIWPILGDPTQLHQVLMNLCVNARDAMPEGGTLTLAVQHVTLTETDLRGRPDLKPGPYVVLRISDTGTGMSAEIQDNIFDPFFTTKELDKGTGLGLATVLGIVKSHEGFIHVESQEGKGSQFNVYLPAAPVSTVPRRETDTAPSPKAHSELILVVDDESAVREVTRRILERQGYRVLAAAEGREALDLYARHRAEIQLVLTDLMMPVMGGDAVIRAMRQQDARLKIIATSGGASRPKTTDTADLHVQAFLQKPCPAETLLETVRAVLEGKAIHNRTDG
jgi:PAS domain S-box-containing protein